MEAPKTQPRRARSRRRRNRSSPAGRCKPARQARDDAGRHRARARCRQGSHQYLEFPAVRHLRLLQRHDLPPRHEHLHDPGRRLHAGPGEKKEGLRPPIKNEWKNGLKNQRGTIAMARTQVRTRPRPSSSSTSSTMRAWTCRATAPRTRCSARSSKAWTRSTRSRTPRSRKTQAADGQVVPVTPVVIKSATVVGTYDTKPLEARVAAQQQQAQAAEAKAKEAAAQAQAEQESNCPITSRRSSKRRARKSKRPPQG